MIALLCLFGGISIASWNALDVLTVELYPSDKRWVAHTGQTRPDVPSSPRTLLLNAVLSDVMWVALLQLVGSKGGMTLTIQSPCAKLWVALFFHPSFEFIGLFAFGDSLRNVFFESKIIIAMLYCNATFAETKI